MKLLLLVALLGLCQAHKDHETLVRFRDVRASDDEADHLPELLTLTLEHSRRDADLPTSLNLVRHDKVYLTQFEDDGVPRAAQLDDVSFYLDRDQQAVITAKLHKEQGATVRTLRGSFMKDGVNYEVEPVYKTPEEEAKRSSPLSLDSHDHVVRHVFNTTSNFLVPKALPETVADLEDHANLTRRSSEKYVVEIFWLTDYMFYKEWKKISGHTKSNLDEFMAHQIAGMDLAYYSLQKMGLDIEIQVKKVTITTSSSTILPTDQSIIAGRTNSENQGRQSVNSDMVLDKMGNYRKAQGYTWYNPDHLTLLTGYDLDASPVGVAPLGGICLAERGVSTAELTGWQLWAVLAHELGHNLGMEHDGQNGCPNAHKIMSPTVVKLWEVPDVSKAYEFSTCNKRQAENCLEGKDSSKFPRICLKATTCNDISFHGSTSRAPGKIDDLDNQCKLQFGPDTKAGEVCGSTPDNAENCLKLMCQKGNMCYYGRASNGSPCGTGKWCIQGKCVSTSTKEKDYSARCVTSGSIPRVHSGCKNTHPQCDTVIYRNPGLNCGSFKDVCCKICTPYGF